MTQQRGRELFRSCQGCHNTASDERRMGPSLRSFFGKVTLRNGKHADDENVREIILEGFNGMPSFRYSLRTAEIDDLMAYLHTLTGKPTGAEVPPGVAYFKAYCLRCHNPDSRTSTAPDLRGHYKPENAALIEDGHAGAPALKDWLKDTERRILFEYLKTY
ncbi:MAG: cytochrome c [Bryobacterales bacterium]|jgi:mono/diheme cytochrome c family protein|nr:cytochrome c [Bryobacterales bacterium]